MPRRKYLDNTIPADNTAQIGVRQRYNAHVIDRWINGGLDLVDDFGTPIITRTPWFYNPALGLKNALQPTKSKIFNRLMDNNSDFMSSFYSSPFIGY